MISALVSIASVAAQADPVPPTAGQRPTDEIVVTGERIPRRLRDTSSSVAALGASDLEALAAPDRIEQILDLIPNVQIGSGGEGPTIRGQDSTGPMRDLPAFLGGTRPRTTLIVDGRAVGYNEFVFGIAPLWDIERVEVFRSPQTTTQGRNSIAGAIFVHSRDPEFDAGARVRGIAGNLRTRQLSGTATGPLAGDDVALRISGDFRTSRPASKLADRAVGADPNHDRHGLVRAKLLATPASLPFSRIALSYSYSLSQMPQIEGVRPPFRERRDPLAAYGTFRTRVHSLTAGLVAEPLLGMSIDTILTAGDSKVRRFAPAGLGQTRIGGRDWSAESLVRWSGEGPVKLVAGLSRIEASSRQWIDLSALSGIGRFRDRQSGSGLFGEIDWALSQRTTLTAGGRYQHDRQARSGLLESRTSAIHLDHDRTFDALLPKLSIAHQFSPAIRAGLLVQRAYNPGGTTLRLDTGQPDPFDAETLWSKELFVRASFAGGAGTVSANLFHNAIRDAQRARPITILAPSGAIVIFADMFNVPRARTRGLEAALDWRIARRLSVAAGIGLLGTKILDHPDGTTGFEGLEFQRSPNLSLTGSIEWRPTERLSLSAQARHNNSYFSDDLNDPARLIPGWTRLDARASWRTGRVSLIGYARNLLDDFYLTYLFSPALGTAGDPREIGIGLEAAF